MTSHHPYQRLKKAKQRQPQQRTVRPGEEHLDADALQKPHVRYHFEDHGQDFLWFDVSEAGVVVACDMQEWVWKGCLVANEPPTALKPGDHIQLYSRATGLVTTIRYPITKAEPAEEARHAHIRGHL